MSFGDPKNSRFQISIGQKPPFLLVTNKSTRWPPQLCLLESTTSPTVILVMFTVRWPTGSNEVPTKFETVRVVPSASDPDASRALRIKLRPSQENEGLSMLKHVKTQR
jgi:hypothetical protein